MYHEIMYLWDPTMHTMLEVGNTNCIQNPRYKLYRGFRVQDHKEGQDHEKHEDGHDQNHQQEHKNMHNHEESHEHDEYHQDYHKDSHGHNH